MQPRSTHVLRPRGAFTDLMAGLPRQANIVVSDRDGLGLATVLARAHQTADLAKCVTERFGIDLPKGLYRHGSGDFALLGIGPGAWLATSEGAGNAFAISLTEILAEVASISDQTDAYAVLRLGGPRVREVLCKMAPIDLHPRAFRIDHVASTVAHHIAMTLWRLKDDANGASVFELALPRSFAGSFWHVLSESAAEFGLGLSQPVSGVP